MDENAQEGKTEGKRKGRKPSEAPSEAKFKAAIKAHEDGQPLPGWITFTPEHEENKILHVRQYRSAPFFTVSADAQKAMAVTLSYKAQRGAEVEQTVLNTYGL